MIRNFWCIVAVLFFTVGTQLAWAGTIQGFKIDAANNPVSVGTISIRKPDLTWYGNYYGPTSNPYSMKGMADGTYEVGAQIPDGYNVEYSVCTNCTSHPIWYPYIPGTQVQVTISNDNFVDLWWRYTFKGPTPKANQALICNIDGMIVPTNTQNQKFSGSWAAAHLFSVGYLGGVVSSFWIGNPFGWVDILDGRSAAGAGFQTSLMMQDRNTKRMILANQAAGNFAQQWGFSGTYSKLVQRDWSPIFSDHYHFADGNFNVDWSHYVSTTPCYHGPYHSLSWDPALIGVDEAYRLHDGQLSITGQSISSPGKGTVTRVANRWKTRATMDQGWHSFQVDQALYLNRPTARASNLRVYLVGYWGWTMAFAPVNGFADYAYVKPYTVGGCLYDTKGRLKYCNTHTDWLKRVVLVYNVGGKDIGIVIHRPNNKAFQMTFELTTQGIGCNDPNNDSCGNLSLHTLVADSTLQAPDRSSPDPVSFTSGQTMSYEMNYDIGSFEQMAALGLGWW